MDDRLVNSQVVARIKSGREVRFGLRGSHFGPNVDLDLC